MNILTIFLLPALILVFLSVPLVPVYRGLVSGKKVRNRVVTNICMFFGLCLVSVMIPIGGMVSAAETTAVVSSIIGTSAQGMDFLAAALVTGLATIGAGIAVASAAPAAIGAVSEDPKAFGKAIIFVVLGEGIAIYGLLISILIIIKL